MPIGPKTSSRVGELNQCSTSSTSWNMTWVAIAVLLPLTANAVLDAQTGFKSKPTVRAAPFVSASRPARGIGVLRPQQARSRRFPEGLTGQPSLLSADVGRAPFGLAR